jgi:hypothetical protein
MTVLSTVVKHVQCVARRSVTNIGKRVTAVAWSSSLRAGPGGVGEIPDGRCDLGRGARQAFSPRRSAECSVLAHLAALQGMVDLSRGCEISQSFVDRMRNFAPGVLQEKVRVPLSRA